MFTVNIYGVGAADMRWMARKAGACMKREANKPQDKPSLLGRIGERFEVDADMIRRGEWIEIKGRNRVEINGVKKIGLYSDTCVRLILGKGSVTVKGCALTCVFYQRGAAAVEGTVESVSFVE